MDFPLVQCNLELDLAINKNAYVKVGNVTPTDMTITDTELYIPVVTLDVKSDLAYKKLMASGKFARQ